MSNTYAHTYVHTSTPDRLGTGVARKANTHTLGELWSQASSVGKQLKVDFRLKNWKIPKGKLKTHNKPGAERCATTTKEKASNWKPYPGSVASKISWWQVAFGSLAAGYGKSWSRWEGGVYLQRDASQQPSRAKFMWKEYICIFCECRKIRIVSQEIGKRHGKVPSGRVGSRAAAIQPAAQQPTCKRALAALSFQNFWRISASELTVGNLHVCTWVCMCVRVCGANKFLCISSPIANGFFCLAACSSISLSAIGILFKFIFSLR